MLYSQRSVLLRTNEQEIDPFQLNPITKALFGIASVTLEVRVLYLHIRGKGDVWPLSS